MPSPLDPSNRRALALSCLLAALAGHVQAAQPLGCLIEAERTAEIGSQVVGIIESIAVERGDTVKKGQVLAVLKAQSERAAVALAKARQDAEGELRAAEAAARFSAQQLARNEDLYKRNFVSHNALDQSRADAEVTQNKLAQARENRRVAGNEVDYSRAQLSQRTIVSPFDGVVTERYLAPGERVEEKAILRVAQIDPLRVQVVVPVSLYGQIAPGDSAAIQPELPGAKVVRAQVTRVDKVIDPASNTFRTLLRIDNPSHALPAGLRCKADFSKTAVSAANLTAPAPTVATSTVNPKKEAKTEIAPPASVPLSTPVAPVAAQTPSPAQPKAAPIKAPVAPAAQMQSAPAPVAPPATAAVQPATAQPVQTKVTQPQPAAAQAAPTQTAKPQPVQVPPAAPQPARADDSAAKPAAQAAAPSPSDAVRPLVEQWRKAWAGKQTERYLSFYAEDFQPPRQKTREAWLTERQQGFAQPQPITISIEKMQTTSPTPNEVKVIVDLSYQAGDFAKPLRKSLLWRKQGERWLIVAEKTLPRPAAGDAPGSAPTAELSSR